MSEPTDLAVIRAVKREPREHEYSGIAEVDAYAAQERRLTRSAVPAVAEYPPCLRLRSAWLQNNYLKMIDTVPGVA